MKFALRPNYSNSEIDRAGFDACHSKIGSKEYEAAVEKIDAWRAAHSYPMHTFNVTLRRKAFKIYKRAIVARRLKRLTTILDKIGAREQEMNLSRMQDIGGVRAVMLDVSQVYKLVRQYLEPGRFSHKLKRYRDYIESPKRSGYRGVHLVFEFNNTQSRSSNARDYDGLNIEVQIRTELQHTWATAVEAIGIARHEDLKSGMGNKKWLEFFQYMSSVIARLEDSPVLPQHQHMSDRPLQEKTFGLIKDLRVQETLTGLATGFQVIMERKAGEYYTIIHLDVKEKFIRLYGYKETEFDEANKKLAALEKSSMLGQNPAPVLVSVGDIKNLKHAYPNFYLDLRRFLEIVGAIVKSVDNGVK